MTMSFSADNFIFWSAPSVEEEEDVGFEDEVTTELLENEVSDKEKRKARESMYVSLVEGMVKTVLEQESFLFSDEELAFFTSYSALSYKARYLLARLLVRKTGKWYRFDQLKYVSELGSDGIYDAIRELCGALSAKGPSASNETAPTQASPARKLLASSHTEIIDLTIDDSDEIGCSATYSNSIILASTSQQSRPGKSLSSSEGSTQESKQSLTDQKKGLLEFFAEDESAASLSELLKCLTVEELKLIARSMKLSNTLTTRAALIDALLASASAQTTLGGYTSSGPRKPYGRDAKAVRLKQMCLSFTPVKGKVQTDVLRSHTLKILKKCIRVNDSINALFHRLHIIYFRSTQHPTSLLTPALLRRCRKRFYPIYTYVRTPEIFTSREALIAYEDALRMEAAIDMMLEDSIDVDVYQAHINAWAHGREKTSNANDPPPHTLRSRCASQGPMENVGKENTPSPQRPVSPLVERARSTSVAVKVDAGEDLPESVKESRTVTYAKYVIEVFERVYPRWQELVRQRGDLKARPSGLERFDEGYILTRVVYKGAAAFGKLKDFDREVSLLEELLSQRRWRRGKRGAWYDRWALILMHHLSRAKREVDGELQPISKPEQKKVLEKAMQVIIEGLHDEDTHIVHRQALSHRLSRLEKRLKIPLKDRHECAGKLQKAGEVKFLGERIKQKRKDGVPYDKTNAFANKSVVPVSVQIQGEAAVKQHLEQIKRDRNKMKREQWKGKSLWVGKCGEEVNVETLALHHYELQGYKGFHSEASIVCTIWGLLFWDILFSSVPGAFETPYQSAPLDIATECFFFARKGVIERRLEEIKQGKAPAILADVDDKYRENSTMCVGVRWNDFSKQDLVEIVTCLGGEGLSVICRLFCEDYGGRHSGIPDLIIWKTDEKIAKFVEVKGPGDNLSENQKVWIDVLMQAGVGIEVCRIAESGKPKREDDMELARRRLPKKPVVIRVYRPGDGNEGAPIDLDELPDAETEEECDEQPRKKQKIIS